MVGPIGPTGPITGAVGGINDTSFPSKPPTPQEVQVINDAWSLWYSLAEIKGRDSIPGAPLSSFTAQTLAMSLVRINQDINALPTPITDHWLKDIQQMLGTAIYGNATALDLAQKITAGGTGAGSYLLDFQANFPSAPDMPSSSTPGETLYQSLDDATSSWKQDFVSHLSLTQGQAQNLIGDLRRLQNDYKNNPASLAADIQLINKDLGLAKTPLDGFCQMISDMLNTPLIDSSPAGESLLTMANNAPASLQNYLQSDATFWSTGSYLNILVDLGNKHYLDKF